jgi:hypothetical protein
MGESKYDVAKEFSRGFCAALLPCPRERSNTNHWLAGYDSGYSLRSEKNKQMNDYLVSIGREPMAVLKLQ